MNLMQRPLKTSQIKAFSQAIESAKVADARHEGEFNGFLNASDSTVQRAVLQKQKYFTPDVAREETAEDFVRPCPIGGEIARAGTDGLSYCNACDYIFQSDSTVTQTYDKEYVASRYDLYPTAIPLAYLRAGFALAFVQDCHRPAVLDVGYGNGSFLKAIGQNGLAAYGIEIHKADYGIADASYEDDRAYDLITFFDSLEHFPHFDDLRKLRTRRIIVSYPQRPSWFPMRLDWKHYRPGEHLHYFSLKSLDLLFGNFERVWCGNFEDHIRGRLPDGTPNIMTAVYQTSSEKAAPICNK